MVSNAKTVISELLPILRVYQDGTVERFVDSPFVPSSPEDPSIGVSSKYTTIHHPSQHDSTSQNSHPPPAKENFPYRDGSLHIHLKKKSAIFIFIRCMSQLHSFRASTYPQGLQRRHSRTLCRLTLCSTVARKPNYRRLLASKDTTISPLVSARLYLPKLSSPTHQKNLPNLVYFHGGGFCIESAFSFLYHNPMNSLASQAKVIIVSVEHRPAPEHPLPAAYEDSWTALQWVASHSLKGTIKKDSWLSDNGDFDRVYIGGDSAGANIAHNMALRAGTEGLVGAIKISGLFLSHPYFWGSDPTGSESVLVHEENILYRMWTFAYPSAPGGIDHPMINPFARDAPSLSGIGCSRLLVCVAGKDDLRERGIRYAEAVRESGWGGDLELFEVEGEGHCFHIANPGTDSAKIMVNRLVSFLQ
ncbi:hypothetical protein Vadar_029716 [Vaccinium darrowii]|uniref:Uncharacterized protein n=1 Tax=Vaccinium darrowii TaxID=229202 RepID=A0ACB7XU15_9ERIC|nr:hypothetical protein Vadar_029716 [Vaccinium darrowii]